MADVVGNALGLWGLSDKLTKHLTGGGPEKSYLGGTPEEQEAQRQRLVGISDQSAVAGQQAYGAGLGTLDTAANQARADRMRASAYSQSGGALGQSGVYNQNNAVTQARGIAAQPTDSLALLQLQQQSDINQRQMIAQAASARGGNQAAAMSTAQANAVQSQSSANQAAAQIRAAEQQAAINRQLGVEQMAAGVGGQQAGLGFGMQGQGLGMAQGSTGQVADVGAQQANAGLGQQNVGVSALGVLSDRDKALLEADRANASARSVAGSPAGAFGSIVGAGASLWGGGKKGE